MPRSTGGPGRQSGRWNAARSRPHLPLPVRSAGRRPITHCVVGGSGCQEKAKADPTLSWVSIFSRHRYLDRTRCTLVTSEREKTMARPGKGERMAGVDAVDHGPPPIAGLVFRCPARAEGTRRTQLPLEPSQRQLHPLAADGAACRRPSEKRFRRRPCRAMGNDARVSKPCVAYGNRRASPPCPSVLHRRQLAQPSYRPSTEVVTCSASSSVSRAPC